MGGTHKTDVVTSFILELEHHLSETLMGDLVPALLLPSLRNLVVLAIHATQIAVPEEDVSGPLGSREKWLLTEMGSVT